jgi:hypothetical protein
MADKLNVWHSIRVSDDTFSAIRKLAFERRKKMNERIRDLIYAEINRPVTTAPAPLHGDISVQESI